MMQRVLFIDDDSGARLFGSISLRRTLPGVKQVVAEDAASAIDALCDAQKLGMPFSLVISDFNYRDRKGGMNGCIDVLTHMNEYNLFSPLIIRSGAASTTIRNALEAKGLSIATHHVFDRDEISVGQLAKNFFSGELVSAWKPTREPEMIVSAELMDLALHPAP